MALPGSQRRAGRADYALLNVVSSRAVTSLKGGIEQGPVRRQQRRYARLSFVLCCGFREASLPVTGGPRQGRPGDSAYPDLMDLVGTGELRHRDMQFSKAGALDGL